MRGVEKNNAPCATKNQCEFKIPSDNAKTRACQVLDALVDVTKHVTV